MSSSTRLRAQLTLEIENVLVQTDELKPFLSAWVVIEQRFRGVADVDESLDPVAQVHCQLMKEQTRTALITEELFFNWLCRLSILNKNIVCTATGRVWEPLMETFEAFRKRSKEIVVSDCLNNIEKVNEFQLWVVQLCNWDGCGTESRMSLH